MKILVKLQKERKNLICLKDAWLKILHVEEFLWPSYVNVLQVISFLMKRVKDGRNNAIIMRASEASRLSFLFPFKELLELKELTPFPYKWV